MPNAVVIVVFLLISLLVLQFGLPFVYGSFISKAGVEIRLFGALSVRTIYFEEIRSASAEGFGAAFSLSNSYLTNRPFWSRCVVIKLRKGRGMLVTPKDPEEFAREIQRRLPY